MAYGARKTEHSGPKKSRGVFCGRKLAAERASS
ncbi:MAG: hypothetical protein HW398_1146, partial [Acidobacteria bacterium]|nr:hypothetical protein [Acidobacteriota bacterium]